MNEAGALSALLPAPASVGDWLVRQAGPTVPFGEANPATYLGLIGLDYKEPEGS